MSVEATVLTDLEKDGIDHAKNNTSHGRNTVLTDLEKEGIDHEIAKFPHRSNACLDALMVVQKHRGYVSDEMLMAVAEYLQMSPTELDSIATFYNLIYRKPVGKKVIRLCDSISCHIMGYKTVKKAISEVLEIDFGETTKDGRFTLLPAQCLGVCEKAPAMMINDDVHKSLSKETAVSIIKSLGEG